MPSIQPGSRVATLDGDWTWTVQMIQHLAARGIDVSTIQVQSWSGGSTSGTTFIETHSGHN